jgi:hypothetical protein
MFVLILSVLIFGDTVADPSIYLSQPKQEGTYITPGSGNPIRLPLEFELFGLSLPHDNYEFCFSLKSNTHFTEVIGSQCLPSKNNQLALKLTLDGQFTMTSFLKEKDSQSGEWRSLEGNTLISTVFSVVNYESALPKIELTGYPSYEEKIVLATSQTNTGVEAGTLQLDYTYSKSPVEHNRFALCAHIVDEKTKATKLSWSCLTPNDRRLFLSNLAIGEYVISLRLKDMSVADTSANGVGIVSTQVQKRIIVTELWNVLPKISLINPLQEYVTDHLSQTATVQIAFELSGVPSAIQQLVVCIEIVNSKGSQTVKYSCLPVSNNVITMQNVAADDYTAKLVVARAITPQEGFSSSLLEFPILIKHPVEFIPSYSWQPLHAWHTIPSGIETRFISSLLWYFSRIIFCF